MQHFLRKENIQPVAFSCRKLFLNMNKYLLLFCSYSEHQRVVFLVFDILSCFKPNHGWGFTRLGDYKIVVRPSSNYQLLQKAMLCSCFTQLIHYGSYYHKGIKCSFFCTVVKFNQVLRAPEKLKKHKPLHFRVITNAWIFSSVESARWMKLQKIAVQLNQALSKSFS